MTEPGSRDFHVPSGVPYFVPTFRIAAVAIVLVAAAACGRDTPEANATTVVDTPSARTDSITATAFPASYKRIVREKWTVGPEGGGVLRFRMPLAQAIAATNGDFFTRRANLDCSYFRTSRSPIGVKIMVVDRVVVRIDVDSGSTATPEGIKIGSTEAQVQSAYGDRAETGPHKYTDGHVITVRGDGDFRFVFETNGSKVTRYRVGVTPAVEWVEGCS
jgi:hypothetical protein